MTSCKGGVVEVHDVKSKQEGYHGGRQTIYLENAAYSVTDAASQATFSECAVANQARPSSKKKRACFVDDGPNYGCRVTAIQVTLLTRRILQRTLAWSQTS